MTTEPMLSIVRKFQILGDTLQIAAQTPGLLIGNAFQFPTGTGIPDL